MTAPEEHAGWYRYTNQKYGFTFVFPPDWELVESKNYVCLNPQAEPATYLIVGFKWRYEAAPIRHLHPIAADGEFSSGQELTFLGQKISRRTLSEQGEDKTVLYEHAEDFLTISVELLAFTISLSDYRQADRSAGLASEDQAAADQIVQSMEFTRGRPGDGAVCAASEVPEKVWEDAQRAMAESTFQEVPFEPITGWERLEETFFGFSLEYPTGWEMTVTFDQTRTFGTPDAIVKRYTFVGQGNHIDLDIFLAREKGLAQWLEWYDAARDPVPLTEPNATIGGYPAVVFVNEGGTLDLLMAYWSDSRYVFRLLYTITRSEAGLQAYRRMLETMSLYCKETM